MYIHRQSFEQDALDALKAAGLDLTSGNGEMFVDDEDVERDQNANLIGLRGIKLAKKQITFNGFRNAPQVYSTLEGGMVPTGVDLFQCEVCGYWMDRKMTISDEKQHDRQCSPQYRYCLA